MSTSEYRAQLFDQTGVPNLGQLSHQQIGSREQHALAGNATGDTDKDDMMIISDIFGDERKWN